MRLSSRAAKAVAASIADAPNRCCISRIVSPMSEMAIRAPSCQRSLGTRTPNSLKTRIAAISFSAPSIPESDGTGRSSWTRVTAKIAC